jgi:hypothetical protein
VVRVNRKGNFAYQVALAAGCLLCVPDLLAEDQKATQTKRPAAAIANQQLAPYEIWYGVYYRDDKVGQIHQQLSRLAGSDEVYHHRTEKQIAYKLDGKKVDVSVSVEYLFAGKAPYELLRAISSTKRGSKTKLIVINKSGDHFQAETTADGAPQAKSQIDLDYGLADLLRSRNWFASGPDQGAELDFRELDIDRLKIAELRLKVVERAQGEEPLIVTIHSKARGTVGSAEIGQDNLANTVMLGGNFAMRRESKQSEPNLQYALDLRREALVPIDRRLGDPDRLNAIELMVTGAGSFLPELLSAAEWSSDLDSYVLKNRRKTPQYSAVAPDDMESSLAETANHPIRHKVIREVATKVVSKSKSQEEAGKRLVLFVNKAIATEDVSSSPFVIDVLKYRKGTCKSRAMLLATLARSVGIPTREVTGLLYVDGTSPAFYAHSWNEMLINGRWIGVDPTYNRFGLNPTYIPFGSGEAGIAKAMRALGALQFKVLRSS